MFDRQHAERSPDLWVGGHKATAVAQVQGSLTPEAIRMPDGLAALTTPQALAGPCEAWEVVW